MQYLTFLLVFVVLAEVYGFKLVIGWFPPVFSGLDRSRSIARSTALGVALSLFEGFIVVLCSSTVLSSWNPWYTVAFVMEPPLTKIKEQHELLVRKSNILLLDTSTITTVITEVKKQKFNDLMFLQFLVCICHIHNLVFRQKEPVSQICVVPFYNFGVWITFGPLRIRCLLHLNYIAYYRPHLRCCYYFASQ